VYFYCGCSNDEVATRFEQLDADHNGVLSPDEVSAVLQDTLGLDAANASHMIEMFDTNRDGNLDKTEFMALWSSMFGPWEDPALSNRPGQQLNHLPVGWGLCRPATHRQTTLLSFVILNFNAAASIFSVFLFMSRFGYVQLACFVFFRVFLHGPNWELQLHYR